MRGPTSRQVIFATTNPDKLHPVSVYFTVKPKYELSVLPDTVAFGAFPIDQTCSTDVTLISPYPRPLKVKSIKSTTPSIVCSDLGPGEVGYARRVQIATSPELSPGPFSASVNIATDAGTLRIPVTGTARKAVYPHPHAAVFEPVEPGEMAECRITFKSSTGGPFRIVGGSADDGEVAVTYPEGGKSLARHSLLLRLAPGEDTPHQGDGTVIVETDIGVTVTIPYHYYVLNAKTVEVQNED